MSQHTGWSQPTKPIQDTRLGFILKKDSTQASPFGNTNATGSKNLEEEMEKYHNLNFGKPKPELQNNF